MLSLTTLVTFRRLDDQLTLLKNLVDQTWPTSVSPINEVSFVFRESKS